MKLSLSIPLFLLVALSNASAQKVPVEEKILSNGMKLLMVRRTDEPNISGGWVAHVGSSNERPGITGIAHLFEHMMFKGTPTIGTKDYKEDQKIIAEQERVRELMRQEDRKMRARLRSGEIDDMLKPENKSDRYKELEKEFKGLIDKQRELLVKNEFDRLYTTAGGSGMNAFTSQDMTAYFIDVPSNRLEYWMWMESERLLRPVFREFYAERDVVFEERRMRTESTPTGKFEEQFEAMFWTSHPYHWPVVGWPSDIPSISKAQADEFYELYYAPQNIALILVGDFDTAEAVKLAEQYFGRIPKGKKEAPDVVTLEVEQLQEKRLNAEAETTPAADILWHTTAFQHPDGYALSVLAQLLSGKTGRLYKALVLGKEVATEAWAWQDSRKWAGVFNIGGTAKDGKRPEEVEQAIYEVMDRLKTELVPAEELQKVKNNFAAGEYRKLASNHAILFQVIGNEGKGDWREMNESGRKIQAVTAEDVRRVANKYFTREGRAVAIYTRKPAGSTPVDPELAALTPELRAKLKQSIAALKTENDPLKLKGLLTALSSGIETAPADKKAYLEILAKKVGERIAELEKK